MSHLIVYYHVLQISHYVTSIFFLLDWNVIYTMYLPMAIQLINRIETKKSSLT
jgi:hypothetical protein